MAIDLSMHKQSFKEDSPSFFSNKNSPVAWEEFLKETEDFFLHNKRSTKLPSIESLPKDSMATATLPQDFAMRFPQQLNYPHGRAAVENNNEQSSEHSGAPRESATSGSPGSTDLELSSNQSNFGTSSNISPVSRTASVVFANPTANFGGTFVTDANDNPTNTVITEANTFQRADHIFSPFTTTASFLPYPMSFHGMTQVGFGFEAKPDVTQMTMREPKPYKCPHCVKSFANNSYLSQHMRIHLGIKPFGPCQYCGKKFTQLSHLQQHIRTHTGEKPYKCKIPNCDKAFSQLSNLQSHSRCHQSDKPFKCNSCYKCFNDEAALLEHIPKHKESKHLKVHICSFCGKSYTQSLYLDKHMTKHADRRSDFRTQNKTYYSSDLTPEAFDSLQSFNSLPGDEALRILNQSNAFPGFPTIMQFQRDAANASASSMSGVAGASPSPYSYPTTTNAAAVTTSLINNFSTSALSSQLLLQQQFNRQQASTGRINGATNGNSNGTSASGSGGFNMITPLEKINSFNQNGVTSNGSESNGLQNAAGGFQLS